MRSSATPESQKLNTYQERREFFNFLTVLNFLVNDFLQQKDNFKLQKNVLIIGCFLSNYKSVIKTKYVAMVTYHEGKGPGCEYVNLDHAQSDVT